MSLGTILALATAGLVSSVALCWPLDVGFERGASVWWLQIISLAWLAHSVKQCASSRQAFASGLLFSSSWLAATFWWLFISMHTYGGLPALVAATGVVALSLVLAIYYAIAAALYWRLCGQSPAQGAALFAALWTLAELCRGTWFTGFGWGGLGYAHTDGALMHWIPAVGVYGVGALAAWLSASLALVHKIGWMHRVVCIAMLGAAWISHSFTFTDSAGKMSVALLQGNIAQDEKFNIGTGIPLALDWYARQIQTIQTDLIVAPETAIPLLPQELPEGYWNALTQGQKDGKVAWMAGIPLGDYKSGYTNSVIAIRPGVNEVWRYDKHHLVPFGEFIPPFFKWFTRMMNIPLGDFNRGTVGQPSLEWSGQRIAANICYEDLFGEELAARFSNESHSPTVFANVSNLGWFGNSTAIDQHLQISRMRALEFQRPFLRATNTGATAIIDHRGIVTAAIPRLNTGVLLGEVEGRSGITPYAWWVSRWGLWPIWGMCLLVVAAIGWHSRGASRKE